VKINKIWFGWLFVAMILVFALAACQPAEPAYEGETVTTVEAQVPPSEQVAVDVNDLIGRAAMDPKKVTRVIEWLLDNNKVQYAEDKKLFWVVDKRSKSE
jgi:hypothetical protein